MRRANNHLLHLVACSTTTKQLRELECVSLTICLSIHLLTLLLSASLLLLGGSTCYVVASGGVGGDICWLAALIVTAVDWYQLECLLDSEMMQMRQFKFSANSEFSLSRRRYRCGCYQCLTVLAMLTRVTAGFRATLRWCLLCPIHFQLCSSELLVVVISSVAAATSFRCWFFSVTQRLKGQLLR